MPLGSAVELMSRITCPLPGVVESAPETEMGAGPPLTIRSTAASPANASELALNVPPVAWPSELSGLSETEIPPKLPFSRRVPPVREVFPGKMFAPVKLRLPPPERDKLPEPVSGLA